MLKTRLGAVPVTEVKTPQPLGKLEQSGDTFGSVLRSSWYGRMASSMLTSGKGQDVKKDTESPVNCKLPFAPTSALVNVEP
jgi:hypothetical protein